MKNNSIKKLIAYVFSFAMLASVIPTNLINAATNEPIVYNAPTTDTISSLVANGTWKYEYSTPNTTEFHDMTASTTDGVKYQDTTYSSVNDNARVQELWGKLYITPGNNDAVLSFVAPQSGTISIDESVAQRHYGENDDSSDSAPQNAKIAIYNGTEKIWPEDGEYTLSNTNSNTATVPAISGLNIPAGAVIRFVVRVGDGAYWNDIITWFPTIRLTPGEYIPKVEPVVYNAPTTDTISSLVADGTWKYEYTTPNATDFRDMTVSTTDGVKYQDTTYSSVNDNARVQELWGKLYLTPGNNDAVLSFVAPQSGTISIDESVAQRHFGENDDSGDSAWQNAKIAIYNGTTKVWPEDGEYTLSNTNANTVTVPAITGLNVPAGAVIRFVVRVGDGAYWNDIITWFPTIRLTPGEYIPEPEKLQFSSPTVDTIESLVSEGTWKYEYAETGTTRFYGMTKSTTDGVKYQDITYSNNSDNARLEELWGKLYLTPGNRDAVMTFVAPETGIVTIDKTTIQRHFGNDDDSGSAATQNTDIAIYKDNVKVWPESGRFTLSNANANTAEIPKISNIEMKKGQKLRFVVGVGDGAYWNDITLWPVALTLSVQDLQDTGIEIPTISAYDSMVENTTYNITLKTSLMSESKKIQAYNVKTYPGSDSYNAVESDSVDCPMINFGMSSPVTVKISGSSISSATILPATSGVEATVNNGTVTVTIEKPSKFCVRINGDKFNLIYVFANEIDADSEKTGDNSLYYSAGQVELPQVATNGWKGAISNIKIYNSELSSSDANSLSKGNEASAAYSTYWKLDGSDDSSSKLETWNRVGNPQYSSEYSAAYAGASDKAMVFNGFEDAMTSGLYLGPNGFSISAWVYLDNGALNSVRTIIKDFLFVRTDGTVCSNVGGWENPYVSTNKLQTGCWNNVVLTVDSNNTTTVYINGVSGGRSSRGSSIPYYVTIGSGTIVRGIHLRDNQNLYLDYGAVLHGTVIANGVENASVRGNGVIDASKQGTLAHNGLNLAYSKNITVEGVTVCNSNTFASVVGQVDGVKFNNVKIFTSYGAADGIHINASNNVEIYDCFIRTIDDCIALNNTSINHLGETKNVSIRGGIFASDGAHVFFMGVHSNPYVKETLEGVNISDVDIIENRTYYANYYGTIAINAGDRAQVNDVAISNIRVANITNNSLLNIRVFQNDSYNIAPGSGISNVSISNISYNNGTVFASEISGYSNSQSIDNLSISDVKVNGSSLNISYGNYVYNTNDYLTSGTQSGDFITDGSTLVKYLGNFESVQIPNGITKIGKGAFSNCYKLAVLTGMGNVTEIDDSAFSNCTALSSIDDMSKVISIGDWAFFNCKSLDVSLYSSKMSAVGSYAFSRNGGAINVLLSRNNTPKLSDKSFILAEDTVFTIYKNDSNAQTYANNNGIKCQVIGDSNQDTQIDIKDLVRSKKMLAGGEYSFVADINADASLNATDIVYIRKYLIGADLFVETGLFQN